MLMQFLGVDEKMYYGNVIEANNIDEMRQINRNAYIEVKINYLCCS